MRLATALMTTAVLWLTACGGAEDNKAADNASAEAGANSTATAEEAATVAPSDNASTATATATATAGAAPTRDYVVGRWGEDGDCTLAIDFRADGTTDGPFGNWTLEGNQLTMADNPQAMTVRVVDPDTMSSVGADGRTRRLTRC